MATALSVICFSGTTLVARAPPDAVMITLALSRNVCTGFSLDTHGGGRGLSGRKCSKNGSDDSLAVSASLREGLCGEAAKDDGVHRPQPRARQHGDCNPRTHAPSGMMAAPASLVQHESCGMYGHADLLESEKFALGSSQVMPM